MEEEEEGAAAEENQKGYFRRCKWGVPFLASIFAIGLVILSIFIKIIPLAVIFGLIFLLAGYTVLYHWVHDCQNSGGSSLPSRTNVSAGRFSSTEENTNNPDTLSTPAPSTADSPMSSAPSASVSPMSNSSSMTDPPPDYSEIMGNSTKKTPPPYTISGSKATSYELEDYTFRPSAPQGEYTSRNPVPIGFTVPVPIESEHPPSIYGAGSHQAHPTAGIPPYHATRPYAYPSSSHHANLSRDHPAYPSYGHHAHPNSSLTEGHHTYSAETYSTSTANNHQAYPSKSDLRNPTDDPPPYPGESPPQNYN